MKTLPQWMLRQTTTDNWRRSPLTDARWPRPTAARTVHRAAGAFARLAANALRADDIAERGGLLQRVDARARILGLVGLLVSATLMHSLIPLEVLYGACLALAAASGVPARRMTGVWLVVPLFTAAVMLPAALNMFNDGRHLWVLWRPGGAALGPLRLPEVIAVTDTGLLFVTRFVLRTAVCVSLVVLLTSTTSPARLFGGLRSLGVPRIFVMLLNLMHRYLGVIARAAEEIHLAKVSRSVRSAGPGQERAWLAAGMGALFRRTRALGHAVYLAMISRGYSGDVRLLDQPRWRAIDWAFLVCAAAMAAALLVWM